MTQHHINGRKINTHRERTYPGHSWVATEDNYDEGSPAGTGATEQEAIDDLLAEIEWRAA